MLTWQEEGRASRELLLKSVSPQPGRDQGERREGNVPE